METNYYDFMRVEDLKQILDKLPNDMLVVIPVVDEEDVNHIYGFRKVRTAGILECDTEPEQKVFCLNGAAYGQDILDQVHNSGLDVGVAKLLYGKSDEYDAVEKVMNAVDKFVDEAVLG